MSSKAEIDGVTAEFFGAFDNRGGKAADLDRIRRFVLPGGVITMTGPRFTVYTVDEFIEPRGPRRAPRRAPGEVKAWG
ncbi:hypothetical protein ACFWNQ_20735 [Streptomyces virginiae]|uniref:hypothetical protein n=1 Tax=Streptomyces virginiae TaxID=1961 RepID=UPI0036530F58